jgi:hypothetical protein
LPAKAIPNGGSWHVIAAGVAGTSYTIETDELPGTATNGGRLRVVANDGVLTDEATSSFLAPVENPPALNIATAGSAVPIRFSLLGSRGRDAIEPGYPQTEPTDCATGSPSGPPEETDGTLRVAGDEYVYVWKTKMSWRRSCRALMVALNDGTVHLANFAFR